MFHLLISRWPIFGLRADEKEEQKVNTGEIIREFEKSFLKKDLPDLEIGDAIKMRVKVAEADKVRVHPFEGSIIRMAGSGVKRTFTVRKLSYGEGVERTFPLHSPLIESINVISKGRIRRAKLYYLRGRIGKRARIKKRQ